MNFFRWGDCAGSMAFSEGREGWLGHLPQTRFADLDRAVSGSTTPRLTWATFVQGGKK